MRVAGAQSSGRLGKCQHKCDCKRDEMTHTVGVGFGVAHLSSFEGCCFSDEKALSGLQKWMGTSAARNISENTMATRLPGFKFRADIKAVGKPTMEYGVTGSVVMFRDLESVACRRKQPADVQGFCLRQVSFVRQRPTDDLPSRRKIAGHVTRLGYLQGLANSKSHLRAALSNTHPMAHLQPRHGEEMGVRGGEALGAWAMAGGREPCPRPKGNGCGGAIGRPDVIR